MSVRGFGLGILCLGLAVTAGTVFAQRGPGRGGGAPGEQIERGFNGERNFLGRLTSVLDLNAAQVSSAEALIAAHQEATASIREGREGSREAMQALIEQGDATAIGNAVLAQHAVGEQLRGMNEQLLADFGNLLTTTQREQFATIQEMGRGGGILPGLAGPGRRGGPRAGDEGFGPRGGRDGFGPRGPQQ